MGELVGPLPGEIFDVPASEIPAIHEKVNEGQQLPAFNNPKGLPNGKYKLEWNQKKSLEAHGPEIDPDIWFRTKPLDRETIDRLQSVQLFAESHDQGFCDNPLAGNWTWFQLAILKNERSRDPKIKDDIELSWLSHNNCFMNEGKYDWRAGTEFKSNHHMLRLLEEGDVIGVQLCARFAGWKITARKGFLVLELGPAAEKKPVEYGNVKAQINTLQDVFQEINASLVPDSMQIDKIPKETFQAEMFTTRGDEPLRVLSLDGGGVRGIAALMLLKAVMEKAGITKDPWQVFDMIGGTSTGGFIAIMLGRFRMSIDDCIKKYETTMGKVFPVQGMLGNLWKKGEILASGSKWDAKILEQVIKDLVKEQTGQDGNSALLFDKETSDACKVFVMATKRTGSNNGAPAVFRSYNNPLVMSDMPDILLWEAARATSAAPMYFAPLVVKRQGKEDVQFLDGGLQANNPLGWLWNEVLTVFGPARQTACFLSIGTGTPKAETVSDVRNVPGVAGSMASIATNSEITNILFRSLINAFAPRVPLKKYWRLNVGDGIPEWVETEEGYTWQLQGQRVESNIGDLDDVAAIPMTRKAAENYIKDPATQGLIADCANSLKLAV